MNNKLDQHTLEELFHALEEMEAEFAERQAKIESKLFSPISIPYQLSEILPRYTKAQLDDIRRKLGLKSLSNVKKQDLIEALVNQIPDKVVDVFTCFDEERYLLAKKIEANGGYIPLEDISFDKVTFFLERGVIFPGVYEGQKVLSMPKEIMDIFQKADHKHLSKLAKRNSEWIKISNGLLYYYGVLEMNTLIDMVAKLTHQSIDDGLAFVHVLYDAIEYYDQIHYDHRLRMFDLRVLDTDSVVEEQNMRADINYYPFSKQQLLRAGESGYVEKSPERSKLVHFLLEYYDMTKLEAEHMVEDCIHLMLLDKSPQEILKFFEDRLEFPSMDDVTLLMELCTNLHNNTRMWILKGYTPEELFQIEKNQLKPLPTIPLASSPPRAQVIDFQTRRKIGRNDPCPCGSGRKYKHCCGKS